MCGLPGYHNTAMLIKISYVRNRSQLKLWNGNMEILSRELGAMLKPVWRGAMFDPMLGPMGFTCSRELEGGEGSKFSA
jgi:hypothetical protein